jgi:hypothetical protein
LDRQFVRQPDNPGRQKNSRNPIAAKDALPLAGRDPGREETADVADAPGIVLHAVGEEGRDDVSAGDRCDFPRRVPDRHQDEILGAQAFSDDSEPLVVAVVGRRASRELSQGEQRAPFALLLARGGGGRDQHEREGSEEENYDSPLRPDPDILHEPRLALERQNESEADEIRDGGLCEEGLEEGIAIAVLIAEDAEDLERQEGRSECGDPEGVLSEAEKTDGRSERQRIETGHVAKRVVGELRTLRDLE